MRTVLRSHLSIAGSHVCEKTKPFQERKNRLPLNFGQTKVPLKAIMNYLNLSELSLRSVLAFAKKNPETLVVGRKLGSGNVRHDQQEHPEGHEGDDVLEKDGVTAGY
jgi:hypothetical protein